MNGYNGSYARNEGLAVTPLFRNGTETNSYLVRRTDCKSTDNANYQLQVPTTAGSLRISRLAGRLSLNSGDSGIHATDYDVGGINLLYSTAEIFTWVRDSRDMRVLVLISYGVEEELHEFALEGH